MSNISVGDLVVVIKSMPCCGDNRDIGRRFIVQEIGTEYSDCESCGKWYESTNAYDERDMGFPIEILKKVPPLSELDDIKTNEEIPA